MVGEIKQVSIGELKKGNYVVVDGVASTVSDIQISRPGKHGHAKIRMTAVGILDDKKRVIVMPGHDKIDVPIIGKKSAQVLSVENGIANVMDMETYETFDLKVPEDLKDQVISGVTVVYWEILTDRVIKQIK